MFPEPQDIARSETLRVPYQKLLDEVTSDKLVQAALSGHWGTYGLPPSRSSVIVPILVLNHYLAGAYYPHGGSGAFRDAFLNALQSHGAEMKNKARVLKIEKKGSEFCVETESGEKYTSQVVISDADPSITLGRLMDPRMVPSKIQQKARRLRSSIGAFCAFIGTDLDLPAMGMTSSNIHVKGACYGPEQTPDQTGPGRFSSLAAGIKGLFLVGAGTLGGGIMPCVASGVLAGEKAAKLLSSRS